MKRALLVLLSLLVTFVVLEAQDHDSMVSKCVLGIGENTTYLKDFVIKLPKSTEPSGLPVHKANIYLMKNQNYRFTMCSDEILDGELTLDLYDKTKLLISTINSKSGMVMNSFDFSCNKTGIYQLWYSFKEGHQGMGVGVVSLVK